MIFKKISLVFILLLFSHSTLAFNNDYRHKAVYFDKNLLQGLETNNPQLITSFDKPAIIIFWATWCYICVGELPDLLKAAKTNKDINYIFVNQYQSMDEITQFTERLGLKIPNIVINNGSKPQLKKYAKALPVMLFINKNAQIIANHRGKITPSDLTIKTMLIRNN